MPSQKYTLVEYESDYLHKQPDSTQKKIQTLLANIEKASDSLSKVNAYTEIINYYNQIESPENSALKVYEKAAIVKNANSWAICGDNFIHLIIEGKGDTTLIADIASHAVQSYENAVALDSTNMDTKVKLAQCYMELENQPMKGVPMLMDIAKKYPNHIQAQFLLAKFGLISGQYEKVLGRLEKVLSLQPQNVEARLMRVDAYMALGNAKAAVADLRTIESMKSIPMSMKKELTAAIREIESKQNPSTPK